MGPAGSVGTQTDAQLVSTHFTSVVTGDDLLSRFWEIEEKIVANCTLTPEERCALDHFNSHHSRDIDGRFVVPLPKRSMETKLGESRSQVFDGFCHLRDPFTLKVSSLKCKGSCKSTLTSSTLKKSHRKT